MDKLIAGVQFTPLNIIETGKGNVLHALKANEPTFTTFGEAYFSEVKFNMIKGWKKHTRMTLNLVVPVGSVEFVIHDDREGSPSYGVFNRILIDRSHYGRLTVSPGLWMAFRGKQEGLNLLLNIASIPHDPSEAVNKELGEISYAW